MKRLKPSICSFLIATVLFAGVESLWGQVKEKRVDQTFNVNSNTRLSINNKFGKVHINTWDQNKIEALVTVEVDGSESSARDILDRINIDVSESTSEIRIKTDIDEVKNHSGNRRFTINYEIKMPRNNPLTVDHRHGDIYLDNLNGSLDLELAHGQIVAEELKGKSKISIQHGNGGRIAAIGSGSLSIQHYQRLRLGQLGSMDLDIAHASFEADGAGDLDINIRHSKASLGNAGAVDIDIQHSKLEVESLKSLKADLQHSNIDVEKLQQGLNADCNHSGIKINRLSKNFNEVEFSGNHSYLSVDIESGASATLEAKFNHGKLNYSESSINMSHVNVENNRSEYKGKFGNGSGGRIQLNGNFTDVSLDIN